MCYPSVTVITADPLVIVLILSICAVNLLAELTIKVVVVIFVADPAEKAVLVVFDF